MPDPDFTSFAGRLRDVGIANRYAERAADELAEHYADLISELRENGWEQEAAAAEARQQLGPLDLIATQMAAHRELRSWWLRWPRLARVTLPLACVAALPFTPVIAGVLHKDVLMRWSFAMLASALFTATLLGVLQLSIQLS